MIVGFILGGIVVPVQPYISVKAENLLGEGVPWLHLPIVGELPLVNTLPTLLVTVFLIVVLAYFTNRSMRGASARTWCREELAISWRPSLSSSST